MRKIKFRGKRINNVGWAYGYYAKHETRQMCPIGDDKLQPLEIKHLIVIDSFADWNMPRRLEGIEVIPETVGQYTGLEDKNGVEIYEGDIIQLPNEDLKSIKVICEFGKVKRQIFGNLIEITGFYFKRLNDGKKTFPIINNYLGKQDTELFEVIGNIYENPELLEEVE